MSDGGAQGIKQFLNRERLDKHMHDACMTQGIEMEWVGRDDNNRQCHLMLVHMLQYGEAAHARKNQIKNQHCRYILGQRLQSLHTIGSNAHAIGGTHQHSTQQVGYRSVILNQQDITM
jgi:hypothetical protein